MGKGNKEVIVMNRQIHFFEGIKDGIPICLGYLAVSFTFGIVTRNFGLSVWEAVVLSATNVTSAGQFAGLSLIASAASYMEVIVTQFIINLRYCLMSAALSQKLDTHSPFLHRFLIAFGVTDEIFAVSIGKKEKLNPYYSYGVILVSVAGWVLGTFLGSTSGNILPARIISALSVALYGMFIAIVIPPARENRVLAGIVLLSMGLSFLFAKAPILRNSSSGFRIILLTLLIAGVAAWLFPVKDETAEEELSHEA
jgi:predicted branched-subunit amino acid permease